MVINLPSDPRAVALPLLGIQIQGSALSWCLFVFPAVWENGRCSRKSNILLWGIDLGVRSDQDKIWEDLPVLFKAGTDFQPFLRPAWPPAPILQDVTREFHCPAKTSHEKLMGRMFPCCFPDRLLDAVSSSPSISLHCVCTPCWQKEESWGWQGALCCQKGREQEMKETYVVPRNTSGGPVMVLIGLTWV